MKKAEIHQWVNTLVLQEASCKSNCTSSRDPREWRGLVGWGSGDILGETEGREEAAALAQELGSCSRQQVHSTVLSASRMGGRGPAKESGARGGL